MELKVKDLIKQKGMTMQQFAEMLGVTRDTLTRNINGNPTLETLERIATALNVPITELFSEGTNEELTALIQHKGDFYKATTIAELEKVVSKIKKKSE